jgi:class 3 adenylate cyclase
LSPGAPAAVGVERRFVSVLFADLVGFTTLSEDRDAEDVRDLLSRYFELARTLIERHGGAVEKFIGDAVMAVWGTPTAREDDAEPLFGPRSSSSPASRRWGRRCACRVSAHARACSPARPRSRSVPSAREW